MKPNLESQKPVGHLKSPGTLEHATAPASPALAGPEGPSVPPTSRLDMDWVLDSEPKELFPRGIAGASVQGRTWEVTGSAWLGRLRGPACGAEYL